MNKSLRFNNLLIFFCSRGKTRSVCDAESSYQSYNSKQQTTVKSDTYNTVWNESFTFYLNHDKKNTLGMCVHGFLHPPPPPSNIELGFYHEWMVSLQYFLRSYGLSRYDDVIVLCFGQKSLCYVLVRSH
jgi:hypothetical protein